MFKSAVFQRFMRRKFSVAGAVVLIIFVFAAIFGPMLCSQDPLAQDVTAIHGAPSAEHWFGTDYLGRDIFTRIIYGARVSLSISLVGVICGSAAGILLGICAGYFGKWVDSLISRALDILLAFPGLLLAIMIVAIMGKGLVNTAIAIAVMSVPSVARMVRGVVLRLRSSEYISACRVMGASNSWILATHIIPNSVSQIIVNMPLSLGTSILTASSLSFLGLGVQAPQPEWGAMLSKAREVVRQFPREALIPGIAITLVVLSFSLVGDGLRDALDPQLKNRS